MTKSTKRVSLMWVSVAYALRFKFLSLKLGSAVCFALFVLSSNLSFALVVEDFQKANAANFPQKWEAQRSLTSAQETYVIQKEGEQAFLRAKDASQRIFVRFAWDPREHPIVTWKWRVVHVPPTADFLGVVYVSLDTDLMVIPVSTKYIWSAKKPQGTLTEGGLFGAAELVLRSGTTPVGEWVEERVNAYEDFKRIHQHEPAPKAWGISILGGPGVEIDFASIELHAR